MNLGLRFLLSIGLCLFLTFFIFCQYNGSNRNSRDNILALNKTNSIGNVKKKLHGRFLHITDIHPDDLYQEGSSINLVCHYPMSSNDNDDSNGDRNNYNYWDWAPKFGKPMSGCDSPMILMESTIAWIKENLKDKIDFIIWTGDNMRHDNDRNHPRLESAIFDMNQLLTTNFYTQICKDQANYNPRDLDIDLVPSIGNNDVFPHNVFAIGPTLQTREFYKIWHWLIPEEQQKLFDRYGSFMREVIPGRLAVISINTLYMFKANPLADNCMKPSEPGYQLLIWLGYVLEELRQRGMKVWLSGHVPPLEKNFETTCFHKFTLWTHEYRDIIIGGLYGHMNMDHFVPLDGTESRYYLDNVYNSGYDPIINVQDADLPFLIQGSKPKGKETYMEQIRSNIYRKVAKKLSPKRRKRKGKLPKTAKDLQYKYSIVNIAGSVIPTFNPSMRVWEYNITGFDHFEMNNFIGYEPWDQFFLRVERIIQEEIGMEIGLDSVNKEDKTIPRRMPKDMDLEPAYEPQLFSPTKFIQYYADLDKINAEYYQYINDGMCEEEAVQKAFKYEIEYTSEDNEPFKGRSLFVHDYMEIAAELSTDDDLWKPFLHKVFGATDYKDE